MNLAVHGLSGDIKQANSYYENVPVPPNDRYVDRFEDTQAEAQGLDRGIWSLSSDEQAQLTDRGNGIGGGCNTEATQPDAVAGSLREVSPTQRGCWLRARGIPRRNIVRGHTPRVNSLTVTMESQSARPVQHTTVCGEGGFLLDVQRARFSEVLAELDQVLLHLERLGDAVGPPSLTTSVVL